MLVLFIVIIVLVCLYKKSADKGDIICAARNNPNPDVIINLIKRGCNLEMGATGFSGYTPLLMAIKRNPNPEIARILIKSGANVHQMGCMDSMTPLSLLLQQKNPSIETLNLLLEKKALVSVPDCSEQTPLDYARKLDCPERDAIISKLENQKNYEKENIIELCIVDEENLKMVLYGNIATNNSDPFMLIYKIEEDTKNYKITWPFYFNLLPTGIGIFTDKNSNKIYHFQIHSGIISYVRDEKRLLTEDPINQVIQSMATNLNEKIITMYSKFSDNK